MEKRAIIVIVLAVLVCCSISNASITNLTYASDGDGAFVCTPYNWEPNTNEFTLSVYGDQYWAPGHMLGDVYTDTAEDPTLTISSGIENDTTFAWTAYFVNVYMSTNFTISNVTVINPPITNWTVVSVSPVTYTGSNYVASIEYDTGTPVAIGDELDFSYKLSFLGSTHYSFTQEMTPVPEPGTLGLVTISGLLLGGFKLARRWRRA